MGGRGISHWDKWSKKWSNGFTIKAHQWATILGYCLIFDLTIFRQFSLTTKKVCSCDIWAPNNISTPERWIQWYDILFQNMDSSWEKGTASITVSVQLFFFSLFPFITITPNPVFTSNTALVLIHLCNHQKRLFLQKWMQSSMVFLENCTLVDDNKIVHYTFYPITHLKTKWKKKHINVLLVFFHLIAIASVLRYIVWPSVCSVTQA